MMDAFFVPHFAAGASRSNPLFAVHLPYFRRHPWGNTRKMFAQNEGHEKARKTVFPRLDVGHEKVTEKPQKKT